MTSPEPPNSATPGYNLGMVRPVKWNRDRQKSIADAIAGGNYPETAARYGGISESTYYDWMARGRRERERRDAGEPPDKELDWAIEFHTEITDALAKAEVRAVALIQRAAADTWQAAAWWLERKYPNRWRQVARYEQTGPGGGPIEVASVSPDQLEARVREILGPPPEDDDK